MLTPEIWTMLYKITLSAGLGMVIGAERETRDKPAGLRTHALVAIGSTIFTILSFVNFFEGVGYSFDPSRIAAQVVLGYTLWLFIPLLFQFLYFGLFGELKANSIKNDFF